MSALQESEAANENPDKYECRTCLQECNTVNLIFQTWSPGWNGMENTIAEDLEKIANIQISELDEHSKFICQTCIEQLRQACQFVCLVQGNDRILKLRYPPEKKDANYSEVWPKPIQIDKTIAYENFLGIDVKQEVLSEDDNNCDNIDEAYTHPDYNEHIEIKVEPEEIVATKPNIYINGSVLQHENPEKIKLQNGVTSYNEPYLDTKVKEEPVSDPEDTESTPGDLPLECLLCTRKFVSVSGLKAHVIAQHSYKTVRRKIGESSPKKPPSEKHICAICKRVFSTTTDLMVHETCHNKEVCYGCNAKFDSFDKLSVHRKRCKALLGKEKIKPKTLDDVIRPLSVEPLTIEIPLSGLKSEVTNTDEKPEMLSCELCSEQFSDTYYMKIHQEIHHSKESSDAAMKSEPVPMEISALESIFNEDT
ncbi:hypothetical protein evm_003331 [Chilo suppressalis]|nr:hypothetical protein evm_003331 [Chilo suppressalis]